MDVVWPILDGSRNLKLGKVTEVKDHFLSEITTKDGSLVDRVRMDRNAGAMMSAY